MSSELSDLLHFEIVYAYQILIDMYLYSGKYSDVQNHGLVTFVCMTVTLLPVNISQQNSAYMRKVFKSSGFRVDS